MKIEDCNEFVKEYLYRIGIKEGEINLDAETLAKIQTNHFKNVPFENIDIITKTPIKLDKNYLWDKIVKRNRGGFCYELNYLLACVLKEIGFNVTILSAFVPDAGNEFDHILLRVDLEDPWYVDVALNGDGCFIPIKYIPDIVQSDTKRKYKFVKKDNFMHLIQFQEDGSELLRCYAFPTPRSIEDFLPRCKEFETSFDFKFTHGIICSLARDNGRISLTENKLIETIDGVKTITPVNNNEEFNLYLKKYFNIVL